MQKGFKLLNLNPKNKFRIESALKSLFCHKLYILHASPSLMYCHTNFYESMVYGILLVFLHFEVLEGVLLLLFESTLIVILTSFNGLSPGAVCTAAILSITSKPLSTSPKTV